MEERLPTWLLELTPYNVTVTALLIASALIAGYCFVVRWRHRG